jgi:hypothetical protein
MSAILRKSSFLYFTHLATFSIPGIATLFFGRNRPMLSVMALWVPVWLSSSVLWSERQESYAFLGTLPVTDREIVRTKLGLALRFGFLYWLELILLIRRAWSSTPELPGYAALASLMCAIAVLLAAVWYIVSWRFGQSVLMASAGFFMIICILLTWAVNVKRLVRLQGIGALAPRWLSEAPWTVQAVLLAAAVTAYYGLMKLAVRVKETSEPWI